MILSRSALHGAVVALSFSAPALADDVIVDGKHCNDICQSWLGVKHDETGKISARHVAEPKPVRTSPVTEPVRTVPVKEAVRTPAATEPVRSLPAPRPVRTDPVAEPARALSAAKPVEAQQVTTPPAALPSATQASTRVDPPAQDDGTVVADTPEAAEGSEPPQPSKLVAVRGSIIIQSASEKAADEQQKARLTKEMTRSAVLP